MYLRDAVVEARKDYHFNNEDSLLLNRQKSSYELYVQRNKDKKKDIYLLTEDEIENVLSGRLTE